MKLVLNNHTGVIGFADALSELIDGAARLSVAVSYLQVSGWELLKQTATGLDLSSARILCTDQFDITQPEAIRRAVANNVNVRLFSDVNVYHPKVYISHRSDGRPHRFLLGSSNLSSSAFSTSVEAGTLGEEQKILTGLDTWFDHLFHGKSAPFTATKLAEMEERWQRAAQLRLYTRLRTRRQEEAAGDVPPELESEERDSIDDLLATMKLPLGLLNMDYGGNNARTISKIRGDLAKPEGEQSGKTRSELKLLGFLDGGQLTPLGSAARRARNDQEFARLWCRWIKVTSDQVLENINSRLPAAKRVFTRFWSLRPELRDFFFNNVANPSQKPTLQTLELLCNAGPLVDMISVEDLPTLTDLLESEKLPRYLRGDIEKYQENKGTRGWENNDRVTMVSAWRDT